ncbi:conserved hypothetical protein, partial [Listeria ivanovii FSL F6-596]
AKITPVIIAGNAAGTSTRVIVSHLDKPSARPASRCVLGIAFNASSTTRMSSGKLKIVSVSAPEITEKLHPI